MIRWNSASCERLQTALHFRAVFVGATDQQDGVVSGNGAHHLRLDNFVEAVGDDLSVSRWGGDDDEILGVLDLANEGNEC